MFLDYLEVLWNHKSEWFFITCSLDVLCIWSRDWCFKLGPPLINPSWLLRNKLKLVFIVGILRLSIWRDFFFHFEENQSYFLKFYGFCLIENNPSWLLRNKLKLVFIDGILRLSIWRDFFFILKKTNPVYLDFIVFVWWKRNLH